MDRAEAEKPAVRTPFATTLSSIAAISHRSRLELAGEVARLRLGPGQLSFSEYVGLRLFDRDFYPDADKAAFIGFRRSLKIWFQANFQVNMFGLVNNKVASDLLFAAHGFPTLPTFAIFRDGAGLGGRFHIRSVPELRAFLTNGENYPLFGKPISGYRSLGSTSIVRYDASSDSLVSTVGQLVSLDDYISYVKAYAGSGYLFQRRMSPHAAVQAICGNRLATVRLLTITIGGQPKILRACWKIPAGVNTADNYWRHGNLLAQVDLENGRVLRVLRGDGFGLQEITHHPDTGAPIQGTIVPNWPDVLKLALEGAKVVDEMALIGWDIAPVDEGAVLVELNETPDFKLHQLADRRGMLDDEFRTFLSERGRARKMGLRHARQHRRGL